MITTRNFACYEQQPLSVTSSNSQGSFSTVEGQNASSCMITNYGSAGAQIVFGNVAQTAVATASAAGTKQYYVPAGAVVVVEKGETKNFAAICDSAGTTSLILHAGEGQ